MLMFTAFTLTFHLMTHAKYYTVLLPFVEDM